MTPIRAACAALVLLAASAMPGPADSNPTSLDANTSSSAVPTAARWTNASLKGLIDPFVIGPKRAKGVKGVAVAVIERGVVSTAFAGESGVAARPTIDGDTLFEIGSITKGFTGLLLQEAIARGELKLDDPIAPHLARWGAAQGVPELANNAALGAVTWRRLATHTADIARIPMTQGAFLKAMFSDPANPYKTYTAHDFAEYLSGIKPAANADSAYSNSGAALEGLLLAQAAGKPYGPLLKERVLDPLGLTDTYLHVPSEHAARFALGHDTSGKTVAHWDTSVFESTGGLRSSVNELLKLASAALAQKEPIKSASEQLVPLGKAGGVATNWHLMRVINADQSRHTMVWHNGGTYGANSFIGWDVQRGIGVVVLINSGGHSLADGIARHVWDARLDAPEPLPTSAPRWPFVVVTGLGAVLGLGLLRRGLATWAEGDASTQTAWWRVLLRLPNWPGLRAAPFVHRLDAWSNSIVTVSCAAIVVGLLPVEAPVDRWLLAGALALTALSAWPALAVARQLPLASWRSRSSLSAVGWAAVGLGLAVSLWFS